MPIAAIISFILKNNWARYALAGLAAAVVLFGLYVGIEHHGARRAEMACKVQMDKIHQADLDADAQALLDRQNAAAAIQSKTVQMKGKVKNAPASEDGPIAPVLRNAIDGL